VAEKWLEWTYGLPNASRAMLGKTGDFAEKQGTETTTPAHAVNGTRGRLEKRGRDLRPRNRFRQGR